MSSKDFFPTYEVSATAIDVSNSKPPLFAQVFIIFFALFFLTGLVYSMMTQVPVVVDAPGKLDSIQDLVPVKAQASFTVDKLLVSEGQSVKKNQVLVSSSETLTEGDLKKLRNYLNGLKAVAYVSDKDPCLSCIAQLQRLGVDYLGLKVQGELQGIIQPINDISRDMVGSIQSYKDIDSTIADVRMNINLAKQKLAEIKKRKAEAILARDVENYNTQILSGQTRINEKYQSSLLQIRQQRAMLKARLVELEGRLDKFGKTFTVLAPFDGKVSNIRVKGTGELVSGGAPLMEIMPEGSLLRATLNVQNKDVAQIKEGDEVIITIDALPEIDYGTVSGTVKEITRSDPSSSGGGPGGPQTYDVKVLLAKQALSKGGKETPFILGMSAKGKVVVRYESILKTVYRNLFKIKDDLTVTAQ